MPRVHDAIGVSAVPDESARRKPPALSARWLKSAVAANRTAFEHEMRRERRRLLDSRFDAFWKETSARQA